LKFLKPKYQNIVFFGDKSFVGGNDYEICRSDDITRAYPVKNPQDTIKFIGEVIEEHKKVNGVEADVPLTNKPLQKGKTLLLFDIDGTLTPAVQKMQDDMKECLAHVKKDTDIDIATVGGSDFKKAQFQLDSAIQYFDWINSENGLQVRDKNLNLVLSHSINEELGEENIKKFVNFCLHYLGDLDLPIKRGTFIEYRTGMINLSPIGRNCSQEERMKFHEYNMEHKILPKMKAVLDEKFGKELKLKISIGGQISMDCFPEGWDKTYCLKFLKPKYQNIVFFGDKSFLGGNDYEICRSPDITRAYPVKNPQDTIKFIGEVIEEHKKVNA
jgi:phosphomannomutase